MNEPPKSIAKKYGRKAVRAEKTKAKAFERTRDENRGLWLRDLFGKIISHASLNSWIRDGLASASSLKSLDFLMPYLLLRY